jgi:hypothetical protein
VQVEATVALSVTIPWGPVRTAVNGTVVGTLGEDDVREAWLCRDQLDRRVRLDPATPASLARAAGPRQR